MPWDVAGGDPCLTHDELAEFTRQLRARDREVARATAAPPGARARAGRVQVRR